MNNKKKFTTKETFDLAVQNRQKNNLQIAENLYREILKTNPNYENAHNNLGTIFNELGEYHKAISCYEKAIEINPNFVNAHNNLGETFKALGQPQKAISCYEKAIEINPGDISTLDSLLKSLYEMDDQSIFFKELDNRIKEGKVNAVIGSLSLRSEIKYGIKRQNPFCNDPLKYVLKIDLTQRCDFKNTFVKTAKNILNDDAISNKTQHLLINGIQTAGNLFSQKNDPIEKIKNIIHSEIEKYKVQFKNSKEGLIKSWPTNYNIKGWLVSMKNDGKIKPHIHDYGWLSGSIYINVPPKLKTDSGNLVVCIDDEEHETGKNTYRKKIIDVVTGNLCLFPSSLYHYTIPFESEEERIVLAFDVTPN